MHAGFILSYKNILGDGRSEHGHLCIGWMTVYLFSYDEWMLRQYRQADFAVL